MNRFTCFICTLCLSLSLLAQTKDASTVYSEFAQQSSILRSSPSHSVEYERASQAMLQLYPQLYYHAANFSQHGNANNALTFAKAYVDMSLMPQFQQMQLTATENYATMVYFVASNYYNRKDYAAAATYLDYYIQCGHQKSRKSVFLYLSQAYSKLGQIDREHATLSRALDEFPTDQNLLALAINSRLEAGMYEDALPYVEQALRVKPGDSKLTSLRGQCLEGMGQYEQAAGVYGMLAQQQKSLGVYKHYALNLFNCAVSYNAIAPDRSRSFFIQAIPIFKQVVANDPTNVQYTTSLALAYLYTDQYDELAETNTRLHAMGAATVQSDASRSMAIMNSDLKRPVRSSAPSATVPVHTTTPNPVYTPEEKPVSTPKSNMDFRTYAQSYIENEINQWQQKDPFETIEEYKQRVTEQSRNAKVEALMAEARRAYVDKYERQIRRSDFTLQPYDAENGVFLINSRYGDIVLPVPRDKDQARNFAGDWMNVTIEHPTMDIAGNDLVIRSIDFVTRQGNVYHYSDQDEAKYSQADVNLQFKDIDYAGLGGSAGSGRQKVEVRKQSVTVGESDVDVSVPETKTVRNKTFAFIIGNENYQSVSPVPYALNDARSMAMYFRKTLGIPETNVRVYEDATFGKIMACVRDIKNIASAYNGDIDIIFYYAGHGIPDERTKSAFLLPVDADATQTETCYSVARLYSELGQLGANSVLVLMDACFSGSQRGEGMMASARGVALKARPDAPQGKMVTLSAATGDETAYPYDEKKHGLFSYFVMKHLQNTKGKTTLGDLVDYVQTNVRQQSVVVNHKSQTPTVNVSGEVENWRKWSWK